MTKFTNVIKIDDTTFKMAIFEVTPLVGPFSSVDVYMEGELITTIDSDCSFPEDVQQFLAEAKEILAGFDIKEKVL